MTRCDLEVVAAAERSEGRLGHVHEVVVGGLGDARSAASFGRTFLA